MAYILENTESIYIFKDTDMSTFSLNNLKSQFTITNERILTEQDANIVFKLFELIDLFAGQHAGIIEKLKEEKQKVDMTTLRKKLRDAWYADPSIIDAFLAKHADALTDQEKEILLSWKKPIVGRFLCMKYFPEYAVMKLLEENDDNFYGILGLTQDFDRVVPQTPPCVIDTALLPFQDKIIWDGFVAVLNAPLNRNMCKSMIEDCKKFRRYGLIKTSLNI